MQSEEAVWGQGRPFCLSIGRGKNSPVAATQLLWYFSFHPLIPDSEFFLIRPIRICDTLWNLYLFSGLHKFPLTKQRSYGLRSLGISDEGEPEPEASSVIIRRGNLGLVWSRMNTQGENSLVRNSSTWQGHCISLLKIIWMASLLFSIKRNGLILLLDKIQRQQAVKFLSIFQKKPLLHFLRVKLFLLRALISPQSPVKPLYQSLWIHTSVAEFSDPIFKAYP